MVKFNREDEICSLSDPDQTLYHECVDKVQQQLEIKYQQTKDHADALVYKLEDDLNHNASLMQMLEESNTEDPNTVTTIRWLRCNVTNLQLLLDNARCSTDRVKSASCRSDSRLLHNLCMHYIECRSAHDTKEEDLDDNICIVADEMFRIQANYRTDPLSHMPETLRTVANILHEEYPHVPWSVLWKRIKTYACHIARMESTR